MATPFDPQVLLSAPHMAIVSTLCDDGLRNAPMWYLWEEGALWLPSDVDARSSHRISVDPRVAAEITRLDPEAGILLQVGSQTRATLEALDAAHFRKLLARYLGLAAADWYPWFIARIARLDDSGGRCIKLVRDSTFIDDVSHFRTGPELAWP